MSRLFIPKKKKRQWEPGSGVPACSFLLSAWESSAGCCWPGVALRGEDLPFSGRQRGSLTSGGPGQHLGVVLWSPSSSHGVRGSKAHRSHWRLAALLQESEGYYRHSSALLEGRGCSPSQGEEGSTDCSPWHQPSGAMSNIWRGSLKRLAGSWACQLAFPWIGQEHEAQQACAVPRAWGDCKAMEAVCPGQGQEGRASSRLLPRTPSLPLPLLCTSPLHVSQGPPPISGSSRWRLVAPRFVLAILSLAHTPFIHCR